MAQTNTYNARIQQKHDVEANWLKATTFIPKAGELIVYDIDDTHNFPRFKIGDGSTVVTNLPFVSDNNYTNNDKEKLNSLPDQIQTASAISFVEYSEEQIQALWDSITV